MGWAIGYDDTWQRDVGYGVPARCDHPDCARRIHHGLAHVCGGEPFGGEDGCGLYFCHHHLQLGIDGKSHQVCERCADGAHPYTPKRDLWLWMRHKLLDASWQQWRFENPSAIDAIKQALTRRRVARKVPGYYPRLWPD